MIESTNGFIESCHCELKFSPRSLSNKMAYHLVFLIS